MRRSSSQTTEMKKIERISLVHKGQAADSYGGGIVTLISNLIWVLSVPLQSTCSYLGEYGTSTSDLRQRIDGCASLGSQDVDNGGVLESVLLHAGHWEDKTWMQIELVYPV
ncbi:unnamed protein product [Linum trigynum]